MDLPRRLIFSAPDPSPSCSALLPRSLIRWRQGPPLRRSIGRASVFSSTPTVLGAVKYSALISPSMQGLLRRRPCRRCAGRAHCRRTCSDLPGSHGLTPSYFLPGCHGIGLLLGAMKLKKRRSKMSSVASGSMSRRCPPSPLFDSLLTPPPSGERSICRSEGHQFRLDVILHLCPIMVVYITNRQFLPGPTEGNDEQSNNSRMF